MLNEDQKRCVREIYRDMKAPRSMNRLLQGDVGSGKTLVALCAMLLAVEHGYSAVMMAPTQILAEQHYLKFRQMLDRLDVPVSLVTADRKEESHVSFGKQGGIVVGTHALLYGKNVPERVGLVVIDEQHKFGVNQREKLIGREERPDVLVMTATPIPRTLTLTFYGELDVSILDGVPGGRGAVVTAIRTEKDKEKVLAFVRNQLEEGRQIYVVSPLIDGEDSRKGKAVTKEWDEWKALLPHVDVGLLHGRMSSEEKEAVMKDFRANRVSVLVSTTVVEVGVDVPNATVMIINNAESFGLSQLHQLRGRIGRGSHKSYCILMTAARPEDEQWEKLRIVETTANGFDLAEQDLRLRGPGDVLGTSQSGLKGVRFEEWLLDARLIHRGRQLAEAILAEDPNLESAKYRPLRFLLENGAERRVAG
ncbi:DEAD/DEAH box helicase [uncultured Akkermansia sp.]|uniref:ATP-dependent DNA helicase RecG n=1 Tax=uncultured Akkermansia sp. TaxID=512294 RepID=UPI00260D5239|nr:DEAD/DEAH box helicase [uncultured Akkermansia sp.]